MKQTDYLKETYDFICSDKVIIDRYKDIEVFEDEDKGRAYHNFEHVKSVDDMVEQILTALKYDESVIYKAKIAAILHDIGSLQGKNGHAQRGYEYTKEYFLKNNIDFEGIEDVLEAIQIHSDGFDTSNIIALSLILADKLDIKYTRISDEGKKVVGNRQYAHVMGIDLDVTENLFTVNFSTDGGLDIKEVNEYYFTEKIFKAVESFANKLKLKYTILLDNKEWNIFVSR